LLPFSERHEPCEVEPCGPGVVDSGAYGCGCGDDKTDDVDEGYDIDKSSGDKWVPCRYRPTLERGPHMHGRVAQSPHHRSMHSDNTLKL